MITRARKTTFSASSSRGGSNRDSEQATDMFEGMSMDPTTESAYRSGLLQLHRRKAVQYTAAQPLDTVTAALIATSVLVPQGADVEIYMDTLLALASQHNQQDDFGVESVHSQQDEAAETRSPQPNASTDSNGDASDEELYLRRVSVLYHEISNDSSAALDAKESRPQQEKHPSRLAVQPEAPSTVVGSTDSTQADLKHSEWAHISVAQAFILTAQRMEKVYSKYCSNFDSANQRLIDLKKSASLASGDASTPNTAPGTPATAGYQQAGTGSPFVEHHKGWRHSNNNSNSNRVSGMVIGSTYSFDGSKRNQLDMSDSDTIYAMVVHQFIVEQSQFLAGKTTSWDLLSLLIKPVQRILKYPLLLRSLLSLTQTQALDRSQIERAVQSIESIAESINSATSARVSTATTASSSSTANEDSHSRLTREIRRVLRRKPGAMSRLKPKSSSDNTAKEKHRPSLRSNRSTREAPAQEENCTTGALTSADIEASIEQHEHQLSEIIRDLRRWESDLGTMLCQQVLVLSRLRGVCTAPSTENELDARMTTAMEPQSAGNDRYRFADQLHAKENHGPCMVSALRTTKSYGLLPSPLHQLSSSSSFDDMPKSAIPLPKHHASSLELRSSDTSDPVWRTQTREHAIQYHTALETVYKVHYPNCLCNPLHSYVYPTLNSLLEIYSDGPRRVLAQLSKCSNRDSSSAASVNIDQDGAQADRLEGCLASELQQLFDREKEVVQLLTLRIAGLKRNFYGKVVQELRNSQHRFLDSASELPSCSWGREIMDQYDKHVSDSVDADLDLAIRLPTASGCLREIESGLCMLASEIERDSSPQCSIKSRRRRSASMPTNERYSKPDRHNIEVPSALSISRGTPTLPTSASMRGEPSATEQTTPSLDPENSNNEVDALPTTPTTPKSRSKRTAISRHARKKSSGLIEKFSQLKSGIHARENLRISTMKSVRQGGSDQIKPRAPLGLAIDVHPDELCESDGGHLLKIRPRPSELDLGRALKYEPLPLVDSIRFSRGFIDTTFQKLDTPETQHASSHVYLRNAVCDDNGQHDVCESACSQMPQQFSTNRQQQQQQQQHN
ncbi:hypothetical protein GGI12_000797 [Dipsacomyces acuminosporus]|nr:hypothetical protein GGI12_000797 [Dipsacomyces acuminosporus]